MPQITKDTVVDERYRILERVGSGGMADVYCAEDLQLGRKVALKLLYRRFAEDDEFVERFRREASSAAGLQHPNVVQVYDRGDPVSSPSGEVVITYRWISGRFEEKYRTHNEYGPVAGAVPTPAPAPVASTSTSTWRPGQDVAHSEFGHGWVQGCGHGVVTVRFETRSTGPGQARTFAEADEALAPADPEASLL